MNQLDSQSTFITSLIQEHAPQEVLQLGLGSFELTLAVCQALDALGNSAMTLLTPNLIQHSDFLKEVKKRDAEALMSLVELNRTPADEVLPDLCFQNRSIDLAIINEISQFDQALVALYYIDKMLVSRGTLIINEADSPVMNKLCQYLVTEREYTLQSSLDSTKSEPIPLRLLRSQYSKAPKVVQDTVKTLFNPELLKLDQDPRLMGSTVALTRRVEEGEIDMDFDTLLESIMNQ